MIFLRNNEKYLNSSKSSFYDDVYALNGGALCSNFVLQLLTNIKTTEVALGIAVDWNDGDSWIHL